MMKRRHPAFFSSFSSLESRVFRHSAVHIQRQARHIARFFGCKPGRASRDFLRLSDIPDRNQFNNAFFNSGSANFSALIGVSIAPGPIAFTRIPFGAYSRARVSVSSFAPPLLAA